MRPLAPLTGTSEVCVNVFVIQTKVVYVCLYDLNGSEIGLTV